MLVHPQINPIIFSIGPLHVYWYGLMYVLGFLFAWILGQWRVKQGLIDLTKDQVSDLIFYAALGVVIGGRLGYVLFYDFSAWLSDPLFVFKTWKGGMSFHGGLLGVLSALLWYGRKHKRSFFTLTDFIAPLVPLGLAAGRMGNFINGELWGRVTDVPWGMIFPHAGPLPRHPSQLYEFALEGLLLFSILWIYSSKPRPRMAVSAVFLIFYGLFRIISECFRQPDFQLGFLAFDWLTMGQLLSFPMVVLGTGMLFYSYKSQNKLK